MRDVVEPPRWWRALTCLVWTVVALTLCAVVVAAGWWLIIRFTQPQPDPTPSGLDGSVIVDYVTPRD